MICVLCVDLETAWSSGLCQPGPLGRLEKTTLGGRDKERSVKTSLVAIFCMVPGRSEPPAPNKEDNQSKGVRRWKAG